MKIFLLCRREGCCPLQMFRLALRFLLFRRHHLNGGVIQHFLPRVVEFPLLRVGQEPLLCQRDRLLGCIVNSCNNSDPSKKAAQEN